METTNIILQYIVPSLAAGGVISAIISAFTTRRREKADVGQLHLQSSHQSITSALAIEELATSRYLKLSEVLEAEQQRYSNLMSRLDEMSRSLDQAREELRSMHMKLQIERDHNLTLTALLESNNLPVPPKRNINDLDIQQ